MSASKTNRNHTMYNIVHFLLALVIILALARLVSFDRRQIRIRFVLQLIVIEIALAFFPARAKRPVYYSLRLGIL